MLSQSLTAFAIDIVLPIVNLIMTKPSILTPYTLKEMNMALMDDVIKVLNFSSRFSRNSKTRSYGLADASDCIKWADNTHRTVQSFSFPH